MNSPTCHFLSPVCDVKHNQIFDEKRMIALTSSCHEQINRNIILIIWKKLYIYVYKHIHNHLKYQYIRSIRISFTMITDYSSTIAI